MDSKEEVKSTDLLLAAIVITAMILGALWYYGLFGTRGPDLKVSAKRLYEDYKKNELKADLKYKDKTLLVDGRVATTFSQFDKPNILLGTDSFVFTIQCRFDKNSSRLASLKKGDSVKVIGDCEGKTFGNVFLEDCALQ